MNTSNNSNVEIVKHNSVYLAIIGLLSVAIPVVVAVLFSIPQTGGLGGLDVSFLPKLNAVLNSSTAIALLFGYYFIKNKNIVLHRLSMFSAFTLSSIFLVSSFPDLKLKGKNPSFRFLKEIIPASIGTPFASFSNI